MATETRHGWRLIGRGLAGWYANGGSSPYSERSDVSSSGGELDSYAAEAEDGALVYDASGADPVAFAYILVAGPMVNFRLAPFEYELLSGKGTVRIGTITVASLRAQGIGGLSYIGVGLYEALLRGLEGVRFGRVVGGRVAWEGVSR